MYYRQKQKHCFHNHILHFGLWDGKCVRTVLFDIKQQRLFIIHRTEQSPFIQRGVNLRTASKQLCLLLNYTTAQTKTLQFKSKVENYMKYFDFWQSQMLVITV